MKTLTTFRITDTMDPRLGIYECDFVGERDTVGGGFGDTIFGR